MVDELIATWDRHAFENIFFLLESIKEEEEYQYVLFKENQKINFLINRNILIFCLADSIEKVCHVLLTMK